eukprot:comp21271_c0_seq1/m.45532 comp21271_c0_seq1/g.45532  ORF comp21271_c0_seq1/g.45532 comp21271_c0_seq1/m.45532 type:complete len:301 (+) comp21271_c0_seq1:515-1417(+)
MSSAISSASLPLSALRAQAPSPRPRSSPTALGSSSSRRRAASMQRPTPRSLPRSRPVLCWMPCARAHPPTLSLRSSPSATTRCSGTISSRSAAEAEASPIRSSCLWPLRPQTSSRSSGSPSATAQTRKPQRRSRAKTAHGQSPWPPCTRRHQTSRSSSHSASTRTPHRQASPSAQPKCSVASDSRTPWPHRRLPTALHSRALQALRCATAQRPPRGSWTMLCLCLAAQAPARAPSATFSSRKRASAISLLAICCATKLPRALSAARRSTRSSQRASLCPRRRRLSCCVQRWSVQGRTSTS